MGRSDVSDATVAGARIPDWPGYGSGVYLRSLAITTPAPEQVHLAMEDIVHAFEVTMTHADGVVTGVEGRWHRHPFTSCAGAGQALQRLVGTPLSRQLFDLVRPIDTRQQCTHLFDMACLGLLHVAWGHADRRYDVVVPDAPDGPCTATLSVDGEPVLVCELDADLQVLGPAPLRGQRVLQGFMRWVVANVPAEQQGLYFFFQKALFVSRAQKMDLAAMGGQPAPLSGPPAGTCFGSQSPLYEASTRLHTLRRFDANTFSQALSFVAPR
jgi:hypothetical protein